MPETSHSNNKGDGQLLGSITKTRIILGQESEGILWFFFSLGKTCLNPMWTTIAIRKAMIWYWFHLFIQQILLSIYPGLISTTMVRNTMYLWSMYFISLIPTTEEPHRKQRVFSVRLAYLVYLLNLQMHIYQILISILWLRTLAWHN